MTLYVSKPQHIKSSPPPPKFPPPLFSFITPNLQPCEITLLPSSPSSSSSSQSQPSPDPSSSSSPKKTSRTPSWWTPPPHLLRARIRRNHRLPGPARPDYDLDPGSWTPLFEPGPNNIPEAGPDGEYYGLVGRMVEGASRGDLGEVEEAVREIEGLAERGEAHSKSVLGFMYRFGIFKEKNKGKSFLYHHFAASDGNLQSKMALAYTYY